VLGGASAQELVDAWPEGLCPRHFSIFPIPEELSREAYDLQGVAFARLEGPSLSPHEIPNHVGFSDALSHNGRMERGSASRNDQDGTAEADELLLWQARGVALRAIARMLADAETRRLVSLGHLPRHILALVMFLLLNFSEGLQRRISESQPSAAGLSLHRHVSQPPAAWTAP
jgi:hypothetical protein